MESRLKCPHCGTRMSDVLHRGVTLDWCEFCHSIWFDRTELIVILSDGDERPRETHRFETALPVRGRTGLSCPRCRPAMMDAVGWEAARFSRCPNCRGVLVDRPQLDQLRELYRSDIPVPGSGEVAGDVAARAEGLARLAEFLWSAARFIARLKLGVPPV